MSNFQTLISTLQPSIFTWSYFCDFEKIKDNVFKKKIKGNNGKTVEEALKLLELVIGKENIEEEFIDKLERYPFIREVLPILIATRKEKFKDFPILVDVKNLIPECQIDLFDSTKPLDKEKMLQFFRQTGLKDLFQSRNIKNLVDYVFGVETGLDSNARKNRTGDLMENLVEEFIKDFCNKPGFEYKKQVNASEIEKDWGIKIKLDKTDRRFDFAIFTGKKVYLIETNYYGVGGSKLKAVAREFVELYKFLKEQGIMLLWITDGYGRKTAKRPLQEAYDKME